MNQSDIQNQIENVFMPQGDIDVVFNLDSSAPIVLPTSIYKCSYDSSRMLIYQTRPEVLSSFKFDTMDITALVEEELNRPIRVGLRCRIAEFMSNYQVPERTKENLILIEYSPPMQKTNLRARFRLQTSARYNVEGAICAADVTYASGTYFSIQDISATGIGLIVPKKADNPLLKVSIGDILGIEMKLIRTESKEPPQKISTSIEVVRKSLSYNELSGFIGARFDGLTPEDQESLFHHIHRAQIDEIRYSDRE